jgi:hypothetical protein
MKVFLIILGPAEWALRLGLVLSHLFYNIYIFKITKFLDLKKHEIFVFILLANANAFLLEFFAIGRGYGLAICFMVISIYYYLKYLKTWDKKWFYVCSVFLFLMVYSHLSMLYVWLAFVCTDILIFSARNRSLRWDAFRRNYKISGIILAVSALFFLNPIYQLIRINQIKTRSVGGFWEESIHSFLKGSFGFEDTTTLILSQLLLIFIILIIVLSTAKMLFRTDKNKASIFRLFGLSILFLPFLFSILHHALTNAEFLIYRKILFLHPLLVINLILLISTIKKPLSRNIHNIVLFALTSLLLFNTLKRLNVQYHTTWKYDASSKELLKDLEKIKKEGDNKVKVGITWLFEPSLNYYKKAHDLEWVEKFSRTIDHTNYDYYYFRENYFYPFDIDTDTLQVIKRYPMSDSFLAKPK